MKKKVAIASDHAGYDLKLFLIEALKARGVEIQDLGTHSRDPVDYPDFAEAVAVEILAKRADRGILVCGSGVGVSVAANKAPGIRACMCDDVYSAHQGVEHDNMNVLAIGAWVIGRELAQELCVAFLNASFIDKPRYVRRLEKVEALEKRRWS